MNNSILKNAVYKFLLDFLRLLLPLIFIPYIYRLFTPDIMGNIDFSSSLGNYFFIFAGFGVYTYGLREIARVREKEEERNKLFTELFIISVISSFCVSIIYLGYIYYKFSSNTLLKNMLLLNSIQIISYIFYIEWINEAFENYKFISQKTILVKVLNLIFIFIFIKQSNDYYKYLFLMNIFIFLNNIISFIYIRKYIKLSFNNLNLKKYLVPLGAVVLISNINILYTKLDLITLGFYAPNIKEVALYGIAQKTMYILMIVIMSLITVTIPRLSYYHGKNQKENFEILLNRTLGFLFIIIFPISVGMFILSREIVLFWGGIEYISAEMVVKIFSIRLPIAVCAAVLVKNVIFISQKEKIVVIISLISGLFNLLFKFLLIKGNYFSASSAIFTTMLAEIILVILAYIYIKKELKIRVDIFKLEYYKYLILSLTFFMIKYVISHKNMDSIAYSIVVFICCFLLYSFLLFLIKDKQFIEIFNKLDIKNNIKKIKKIYLRRKNG